MWQYSPPVYQRLFYLLFISLICANGLCIDEPELSLPPVQLLGWTVVGQMGGCMIVNSCDITTTRLFWQLFTGEPTNTVHQNVSIMFYLFYLFYITFASNNICVLWNPATFFWSGNHEHSTSPMRKRFFMFWHQVSEITHQSCTAAKDSSLVMSYMRIKPMAPL